jgi:uncharacterized membrane protein
MTLRGRFVLATLCGLVLGAIGHLLGILILPALSEQDAFSRLRSTMTSETAVIVDPSGWLPLPDPALVVAACAYDLADGPVRIASQVTAPFQSISLHARAGGVYFAVTDRAAVRGALDLVVMTRAQLDEALAAEDESDPSRDVRIVSPTAEGLIVVRVLAPFPSQRAEAEAAARSVGCTIDADEEEEAE